jgi:formamidopyrimidine-DNA glycosylase
LNRAVWSIVFVATRDPLRWAFCDPRRFGKVFLSPDDGLLNKLAPDALLELPSENAFAAVCARRTTSIKALLLDQNALVSGVGNWIADEVLYQAAIHPEIPACSLTPKAVSRLRAAIIEVLTTAVKLNGENFPAEWLFNYRWGKGKKEAQVDFKGRAITHITCGGRTSAVVLQVQKKGGGGGMASESKAMVSVQTKVGEKTVGVKRVKVEVKEGNSEVDGGQKTKSRAKRANTGVKVKEETKLPKVSVPAKRKAAGGSSGAGVRASTLRAKAAVKGEAGPGSLKATAGVGSAKPRSKPPGKPQARVKAGSGGVGGRMVLRGR